MRGCEAGDSNRAATRDTVHRRTELKAATSIGANLEEAKAGSSRREFVRYIEIALREAREAAYWLRICSVLQLGPADDLRTLSGEADQIARILGSIVVKAKFRAPTTRQCLQFAF